MLFSLGCSRDGSNPKNSGFAEKADTTISVWNCIEISFTSSKTYRNPLIGNELCELDVQFVHKEGDTLIRPAFWDKWYNPRTGTYTSAGTIVPDKDGTWIIPEKPDKEDWLLIVS